MQQKKRPTKRLVRTGKHRLDDLPNLLIRQALLELDIQPNVTRLARALKIYQPTLWHYMHGRNRWPAEEWIKMFICLGYLIESPRAFELHLPKVEELCELYDQLEGVNPGDRSHRNKIKRINEENLNAHGNS